MTQHRPRESLSPLRASSIQVSSSIEARSVAETPSLRWFDIMTPGSLRKNRIPDPEFKIQAS